MSTEPAWQFDDVMALAVEANGHLPIPLCDFTPEEEAKLAEIEAAPDAPESVRWRMTDAIVRTLTTRPNAPDEALADVALAVLTEPAS